MNCQDKLVELKAKVSRLTREVEQLEHDNEVLYETRYEARQQCRSLECQLKKVKDHAMEVSMRLPRFVEKELTHDEKNELSCIPLVRLNQMKDIAHRIAWEERVWAGANRTPAGLPIRNYDPVWDCENCNIGDRCDELKKLITLIYRYITALQHTISVHNGWYIPEDYRGGRYTSTPRPPHTCNRHHERQLRPSPTSPPPPYQTPSPPPQQ